MPPDSSPKIDEFLRIITILLYPPTLRHLFGSAQSSPLRDNDILRCCPPTDHPPAPQLCEWLTRSGKFRWQTLCESQNVTLTNDAQPVTSQTPRSLFTRTRLVGWWQQSYKALLLKMTIGGQCVSHPTLAHPTNLTASHKE